MKPKVLIVDDEAGTRALVRRALQDHGWALFEADHGAAALRTARAVPPDVLLLNLHLPGSPDAWDLLAAWPGLPCLVLDRGLTAAERQAACQAGVRQFLGLPCLPAQLQQAVAALLNDAPPRWQ